MAFTYITPYRRGGGSLLDMHKQMNAMFDELLSPEETGSSDKKGKGPTSWPSLDIMQDDGQIAITAELPGVERDAIDINMDDGMLIIRGEKKGETKKGGYSERTFGRFERHISIPATVDLDNAEADYNNGLLTITLPKTQEKEKGRRIELKGNDSASNRTIENTASDKGNDKSDDKKASKKG
ncbi:MAG: Hsp20/alpha crystallin family protein [Parerythrobacter sp.]